MEDYNIEPNAQHLQVIRGALGKVAFDLAGPLIRHIGEQVQEAEKSAPATQPAREPVDDSVAAAMGE